MKKYSFLILFVLLASMLCIGCTGSGNEKSLDQVQNTSTSSINKATPSQNSESSFKIYNIGKTATDGLTKITVNGERYTNSINEIPDEVVEAGNESQFLILNITLENISPNRTRTYAIMQYKILSPDGSTYECDYDASEALSKAIDVAHVTPGNMRRGELAFAVPNNSTGLQFEFIYDPLNSADAVVFNL
ncbi:DUF4352 domain-containing protein [Methanosarcina sp. DH2]|uniref:DUF4352 domain-containing protein n=1 Tax=Methanosarcina sp. DH2 TaxID=2605639 RepID=UPI001E588FF8|nr:DUF4352 domain-containing protein [Methanosarcina sp. DH2]MCC4770380.1 DUF4352 domain-containing protein [Methanosarcina sp. DH2]